MKYSKTHELKVLVDGGYLNIHDGLEKWKKVLNAISKHNLEDSDLLDKFENQFSFTFSELSKKIKENLNESRGH